MEKSTHFCENCGSPLEEGASFCEACGTPVKDAGAGNVVAQQQPPPIPQRPQPPASPPQPPVYRQPAAPPSPPPAPAYYQPAPRSSPFPPPPPGYYPPPAPPPPGYYGPPAPRRKTSTGLIIGGVIVGLLVCCGLAVLVGSLAGGASYLSQIPGFSQKLPPAIVVQETAAPTDTLAPAEPFIQDTDVPVVVVKSTLTSEPAPNEVQATSELPVPQGDILDFTDDLSTNDNQWPVDNQTTGPRTGFYPSAYYIDTDKQQGEYRSMIPKINNNQYKVRDFEIAFYALQWSGDGYLGLDFHYVDDQNYYQAAVKDGKFLVRKKINGQFKNLIPGGWIPSNSIMSGPNKITVVVHSDVIQLKVNDDVMAQLKDDSLPEGNVLLTAGVLPEAPDGTTFEGRFNNFHVLWFVQP